MKSVFHIALLSVVIATVAGIMTSTIVPQVFAAPQFKAQDDKNNPTQPGGQRDKDAPPDNAQNGHALDNSDNNCEKHPQPAQCY